MLIHEVDHSAVLLLVLLNVDDWFLVVRNREVFACSGVCWHLDVGEHLLYLVLNLVNIDVAHDNESLEVWTIPLVVVVAEVVVLEVHDYVHCSDRHAV